jgi:hypothetical protein
LGRKSSRKKNRFQARDLRKQEENLQKKIAYLIIFPNTALFIWGIILFSKTIISSQTQALIIFIGAIVGITVLHLIWRHKNYGFFVTIFYGFYLGFIPYSFIATTNYYLRADHSENVQLEILKTGNRSSRKSNCRTPYAVIEYQHIKKDILFPCDYEKTISNYKSLTLTVSEGFWSFMVLTDKKLNKTQP